MPEVEPTLTGMPKMGFEVRRESLQYALQALGRVSSFSIHDLLSLAKACENYLRDGTVPPLMVPERTADADF